MSDRVEESFMRLAVTAISVILATACTSTFLKQYAGNTKAEPEAAFNCVVNVLTELRYEIKETDRSAGVIKARSPRPSLNKYDASALISELSISIAQNPDSDSVTISVSSNNEGHANTVLAACAEKEPADQQQ
jgi:hypothetical protein